MRTIKTLTLSLLIGAFIFLSSCSKYEEGPAFSLLTKKARITNTWKAESATVNGNTADITDMVGITQTYEKDGTYKISAGGFSIEGTWEFSGDTDVVISTSDFFGTGTSTETYTIVRLTKKELWVSYMDGTMENEIHYIPNN